MNVIYEDQVLYAEPKNEVLFVRIKLPLRRFESFSNLSFYDAIVSNTQYSTSRDLIYSDNTIFFTVFLKTNSMQTDMIFKHSLRRYRQSFNVSYTGAFSDYIFEH